MNNENWLIYRKSATLWQFHTSFFSLLYSQERLPNENSKNKNEKGFETEILECQDYFGRTDSEILSESNLKNVVGKKEKNSEEASPLNLEVLSTSHSLGNFNPQTVIDWIDRGKYICSGGGTIPIQLVWNKKFFMP